MFSLTHVNTFKRASQPKIVSHKCITYETVVFYRRIRKSHLNKFEIISYIIKFNLIKYDYN